MSATARPDHASLPRSRTGRDGPEVYVSGHSDAARRLACAQGSCWLRLIDTPEVLRPVVAEVREHRIEVCLRLCLVCRPTREEAMRFLP